MKIVVYGTGGVGGYFGARLAQAGNDVTFIARGKHLEAIQNHGLKLLSPKGDYTVFPCNSKSSVDDLSGIDLILIAVKTWQLKDVSEAITPVVGPETVVISLLNGIRNEHVLSSFLPKENILGGLCKIVSKIEKPGIIRHLSYEPEIVIGELYDAKTVRSQQITNCLQAAGIKTKLTNNIKGDQWAKFIFIATISAIGALTRVSLGAMLEYPPLRQLMENIANEIVDLAHAEKVLLPKNILAKQFKIIEEQPYDTTASLQRDMMAGLPSEIDDQQGVIVELGKKHGIATPTNEFIYNLLYLQEKKARRN